jgi:hypothetical protein
MSEHILVGHFLTRLEAARRAGIPSEEAAQRPDLLRIGGTWLEEVYFEFQFNDRGIDPRLGRVVRSLHRRFDDIDIADWLARPNDELDGSTPLRWLETGDDASRIVDAAAKAGPMT